jgi:hypothetical protein
MAAENDTETGWDCFCNIHEGAEEDKVKIS